MTLQDAKAKVTVSGGALRVVKDARKPGGYGTQDVEKQRAAHRRHNKTEKGRATRRRCKGTAQCWARNRLRALELRERGLAWEQQPENRDRVRELDRASYARCKQRLEEVYS